VDYLSIKLTEDELHNVSLLGLAHIGDAVFELMVRSWLCANGKATAKGLHKASVAYVAAPAQAAAMVKLMPLLTEAELAVFKRGRNTRVNSVPRSSTQEEYHAATGFEALFGYLHLRGETARLNELFAIVVGENG
jgi:ribonuclease-3 family protein